MDKTTLLWFLYGSVVNNDIYQGHKARDAFNSACNLLGYDSEEMFKFIELSKRMDSHWISRS